MSQTQHITDVLMVGATGSIGRLAVEAAQRHGLRPRALVRDVQRAQGLLPGVELVQGDLEDPASLRSAVVGTSRAARRVQPARPDARGERNRLSRRAGGS
ncbi:MULTISPECIES: NAD(P)H-binding protein [unclassified Streptomyces]|uniref:NAD(P)H-binding protein n=1 Tax=unclassified Streptomyces TaxID=2593676 RepID=UPI00225059B4|nr:MULTISPECIES: NAD(P)H-binding protein [unclassified Streptomyces]MCX5329056.1 NAD(P)H-binding protein [Streptomyces sp. NBC_00140]MCX5358469.1 NAD(P)H-binding protein [Streptomyces sp. NBC_00124]